MHPETTSVYSCQELRTSGKQSLIWNGVKTLQVEVSLVYIADQMRSTTLPNAPVWCPDVLSVEPKAILGKHARKNELFQINFVAIACCLCGLCLKTVRYKTWYILASCVYLWQFSRFTMGPADSDAGSPCQTLQKWHFPWLQNACFFQAFSLQVQNRTNGNGFSMAEFLAFWRYSARWRVPAQSLRNPKINAVQG